MNMPPKIYKYYPFSELSLKSLKSQTVYFASPKKFNDPYDCAITVQIKSITDIDVEEIRQAYINDDKFSESEKQLFRDKSVSELRVTYLHVVNETLASYKNEFLEQRGVCCFTENNNNLLMWSHYANVYTGFCLEFDTKYEPFNKLRKVDYSQHMPVINPKELLYPEGHWQVFSLFCLKSEHWSYEKEWRGLHKEANTVYCYPSEALTGVYFGPGIEHEYMEIICLILQGQNPTVKFYKGIRSQEEFKVEFSEFKYISHLEAVRNGLK